jgi:hypothetical protein
MKNKNLLTWGIHKGTLISRDVGRPKPCNSLEKAQKMANSINEESRRTGYMLWFATWYDENGNQHKVHLGNDYTR